MQRKREHLGISVLVIGAALAAFFLVLRADQEEARVRVAFERSALERLRAVAAAEQAFHGTQGRYGWAEALGAANLLRADWVEAGVVQAPRYRIDVLLPTGLGAGNFVRLAPRSAGEAHAQLARKHFAVVARPWGASRSGHRAFYLDETGQLYISEGVTDVGGGHEPPLPALHLSQSQMFDQARLRWWKAELSGQP